MAALVSVRFFSTGQDVITIITANYCVGEPVWQLDLNIGKPRFNYSKSLWAGSLELESPFFTRELPSGSFLGYGMGVGRQTAWFDSQLWPVLTMESWHASLSLCLLLGLMLGSNFVRLLWTLNEARHAKFPEQIWPIVISKHMKDRIINTATTFQKVFQGAAVEWGRQGGRPTEMWIPALPLTNDSVQGQVCGGD